VGAKPLAFPDAAPAAPLGSFTLLDSGTMLASPACSSPFPNGEPAFVEDKDGPPSRAYLKLYEAFTLFGRRPGPGDTCLDLGASPGGWTWVLARLGATVTAYDRADLAPHVASLPNVTVVKGDAFSARPDRVGPVDWLFSDVICYPEKLLEHVRSWLAAGACRNLLVTLKFQGTEHYGAIQGFREVPGGKLVHLGCNKHELTWAKFTD
jgi:23S rRNA (cytidine2498-2'-O)-methyltransferase